MTGGFQIWPQSSNRTTFDLLLAPKTVENGLNTRLPDWVVCYKLLNQFTVKSRKK